MLDPILAHCLKKLIRDPEDLEPAEIRAALDVILSSPTVTDVQIAGFLVGARAVGKDQEPDFVYNAVTRLKEDARKIHAEKLYHKLGYVDIVGTGGDGKNTFNVSTTSAIVAAGAGVAMCKHGGPASTSSSGASDLLLALGVNLANINAETVHEVVNRSSFTYLSGPVFHPAMGRVREIRRNLGVPSIFNLVGPLLNPAPISARIVGVYAQKLGPVFADVINRLNQDSDFPDGEALVVWGSEGLDEISPAQDTHFWHVKDRKVHAGIISPADFGLPTHSLEEVAGGTPQQNAELVKKLLANELHENNPILDYVLLNTAALLKVAGKAKDYRHGVELARESITSGKAKAALDTLRKVSNSVGIAG